MQQFVDKVAVITGGASGIGFAMAERFAAEGMKLVLADIEAEALETAVAKLRQQGARVVGVPTDVSKLESVQALLARTIDAFDRVHVLCNNAGVQAAGPTWQLSMGQWQWLLGVNLWGVIHGVHVFVPHMLSQGDECHIVNTSSMAGLLSVPMMSAYQVTKHGVVTLSESLAQELAQLETQIGVSVLCPAFVQTQLHEAERNRPHTLQDHDTVNDSLKQNLDASVRALVTGGKPPAEIAQAVVDAIRDRRLHVFTHPEVVPMFEQRADAILAASKR
jgi:NAD(P)-dependent dehydrogenase (short-subunit alcohol dehydrogenase family)